MDLTYTTKKCLEKEGRATWRLSDWLTPSGQDTVVVRDSKTRLEEGRERGAVGEHIPQAREAHAHQPPESHAQLETKISHKVELKPRSTAGAWQKKRGERQTDVQKRLDKFQTLLSQGIPVIFHLMGKEN